MNEHLHAPTLRWVAEQLPPLVDSFRIRFSEHLPGVNGTGKGEVVERIAGFVVEPLMALLLAHEAEARSEPPRLSTLVAACESAGLGEPRLMTSGDYELELYWGEGETEIYVGIGQVGERSWSAAVYRGREELPRVRCSTPAELRAELKRLAQEAQR